MPDVGLSPRHLLILRRTEAAARRVPKSLSIRTHVCTSCGLVLDRDKNAARNIQLAGQALRGVWGVGCGDEPSIPAFRRGECQPRTSPSASSPETMMRRRHPRRAQGLQSALIPQRTTENDVALWRLRHVRQFYQLTACCFQAARIPRGDWLRREPMRQYACCDRPPRDCH